MIYQNAALDYRTVNFDKDLKTGEDAMVGENCNAIDPNLKALKDRGGKLILYHGWSDPALPPTATVNYYENVVAKMGQKETANFVRLYMVPGINHYALGPGPAAWSRTGTGADPDFSMFTALERWVEKGAAPDRIIATKYKMDGNPTSGVARTRPLCPYPQVARYTGKGSTNEAANFTCKLP